MVKRMETKLNQVSTVVLIRTIFSPKKIIEITPTKEEERSTVSPMKLISVSSLVEKTNTNVYFYALSGKSIFMRSIKTNSQRNFKTLDRVPILVVFYFMNVANEHKKLFFTRTLF